MASAYTKLIEATHSIFIARDIMNNDRYADMIEKANNNNSSVIVLLRNEESLKKYLGYRYEYEGREYFDRENFIFRNNEFDGILYAYIPICWRF